jgi:hypothetical protein
MFVAYYRSYCFLFKTRRFGDWILSPSLGMRPLTWVQSIELTTASGPAFTCKTETEFELRNTVFELKKTGR